MTDIPDGGFTRAARKGRPGKKVKFNPNRAYLNQAMADFVKKGGVITKLPPPGNDLLTGRSHDFFTDILRITPSIYLL